MLYGNFWHYFFKLDQDLILYYWWFWEFGFRWKSNLGVRPHIIFLIIRQHWMSQFSSNLYRSLWWFSWGFTWLTSAKNCLDFSTVAHFKHAKVFLLDQWDSTTIILWWQDPSIFPDGLIWYLLFAYFVNRADFYMANNRPVLDLLNSHDSPISVWVGC